MKIWISTRRARKLRPVAIERARQRRLQPGDPTFFGSIVYGMVTTYLIVETKPYLSAIFQGSNGTMFRGSMAYAYPTRAEYEATDVHCSGPPKARGNR